MEKKDINRAQQSRNRILAVIERKMASDALKNIPAETVETIQAALGDNTMSNDRGKDFETLVEEYRHHWKCGYIKAMKAIMKKYPDAHRRYLEKHNPGRKLDN